MDHMMETVTSFMSWIGVGMAMVLVIFGAMKSRDLKATFTYMVVGGVMVSVSLLIPHLTPDEKDRKFGEKARRLGDELAGPAPASSHQWGGFTLSFSFFVVLFCVCYP